MKLISKALWTAAFVGLSFTHVQAQDTTIQLGTMGWESSLPITGVMKKVLEDGGYTVEVTEFSEWGIAYAALASGDIQVLGSEVDYVAQDYWERSKSRLEKISIVSYGLYQAFAVPDYVDISSTEELNDNVDMLGGRIVGIEPGSGLMREAAEAIEAYDLDYQLIEGSTAGMTAALQSAFEREEPIVVTLWDPTWMYMRFNMKFLEDPQQIFAPYQSHHIIAQAGFSEEHPEARELLASVFLPVDQVRAINAAVNDGQTMDEAIQAWIDANGELIERWGNIKDY